MPTPAINALTAPDSITTASTIDPGGAVDHFVVDVANQAIYRELKEYNARLGARSGSWSGQLVYQAPGSRVIDRDGLCGLRFRAAIPLASLPSGASQAVVTVEAVMPYG